MLGRQTTGSIVCIGCGSLVGVNDDRCYTCGRRNPGLWGYAPALRRLGQDIGFTPLVIGSVVILYVVSLLLTGPEMFQMRGLFGFLSPSSQVLFVLGASGALPVFGFGAWWTVLSAAWLHGGLLHILFNVLWIRLLAPPTAEAFGPGRMVIIYTGAGAFGFLLSSTAGLLDMPIPLLRGATLTVGASAPIFGLLGALVYYGRLTGSSLIHQQAKMYAIFLFVIGFVFPGVDNYAHAGGFIGGYLGAALLKPREPERVIHLLVALACLAASALAILASIVTGIRLL